MRVELQAASARPCRDPQRDCRTARVATGGRHVRNARVPSLAGDMSDSLTALLGHGSQCERTNSSSKSGTIGRTTHCRLPSAQQSINTIESNHQAHLDFTHRAQRHHAAPPQGAPLLRRLPELGSCHELQQGCLSESIGSSAASECNWRKPPQSYLGAPQG